MSEIITVERQISMEYLLESKVALYPAIFRYYFSGKDRGLIIDLDDIIVYHSIHNTGSKILSNIEFGHPPITQCLSLPDLLAIKANVSVAEYTRRWDGAELIGWKSATVCWGSGECWVPKIFLRDEEVVVDWFIFHSSVEPKFPWIEGEKTALFKQ